MHFWIDKRTSNLHHYGGGNRGRGGFYNRTFGNRHHHPPPLLRALSNSNNSSHSSNTNHSRTNNTPSSSFSCSNGHNNPSGSIAVPGVAATSTHSSDYFMRPTSPSTHPLIPMQNPTFSINPLDMVPFSGGISQSDHYEIAGQGGQHQSHNSRRILRHGARNMQGNEGTVIANNFGVTQQSVPRPAAANDLVSYMGGADPVIGLAGQYYLHANGMRVGMNPLVQSNPNRRPRSHSHSPSNVTAQGRRRSSAGNTGSFTQRRSSMNRWTYDPYNISHHQQMRHPQPPQMWPDGRPGFPEGAADPSDFPMAGPNNLTRISADLSAEAQSHSVPLGTSTTTSASSASIDDPRWSRTKRIGLTLCFMSFILLSTVAAKFVIEGPLLLDKSLRHERSEPTLYFFLIEFIFVLVAMALFLAGVTCLRKRTNAYLLRQFNQYITQTSHGEAGFFDGTGSNSNAGNSGAMMGMSSTQHLGSDRPFHPNFLPSLENHLLNMHISVGESSNFVMSGLAKPPPYHIALMLPAPGEECEIGPYNVALDENNKTRNIQSSSWISSCLAENDNGKTDDDETEDEEGIEGKPKRKRSKSANDEPNSRPETPPPAYGQL